MWNIGYSYVLQALFSRVKHLYSLVFQSGQISVVSLLRSDVVSEE
jgi:hypothetical protein